MKTASIHEVKPGMAITFVSGHGASKKGIAYGIRKGRFGDSLKVKMPDFSFEYVSSFSTGGIGAYCHNMEVMK